MKIYFENGELLPSTFANLHPDFECDAHWGYSANKKYLDGIKEKYYNAVVFTNSLVAFSQYYAWNEELNDVDIFIREKS